MSIIVSVKINDGIVMAADSATIFPNGQIYEHSNKLYQLVKGVPVGVMTCGVGGIGNASNATLFKDVRRRLAGHDEAHADWALDAQSYTMQGLAGRVYEFFKEKADEAKQAARLKLRICGYSSEHPLPEVWEVAFTDQWNPPTCIQPEDNFGIRWDGEYEALDRLILGVGVLPDDAVKALGVSRDQLEQQKATLIGHTYEPLIMPAAPIQDAIDLARFLVETTKGFIRFSVRRAKTVGGPVEIAAITKHEGFKWVQRKHFYPADLNR